MNGSATNPLSVSPRRGSPPLPLKGARKGADRGEFMPFLHPFRGEVSRAQPETERGLSTQASPLPRPLSRLAIVKELSHSGAVGKRGAGSAPRKVNVWRLPSAPPVVLPDRRGPRGGLCRCGGAAKRARASDENFQPRFRHATGPAPPPSLIPGAHQVPVKAMPAIMEGVKGACMKDFLRFR